MELKQTHDLDTSWSNIVHEIEETSIGTFLRMLLENIEKRRDNIEKIESVLETENTSLSQDINAFKKAVKHAYKQDKHIVIGDNLVDLETMEIKKVKVI